MSGIWSVSCWVPWTRHCAYPTDGVASSHPTTMPPSYHMSLLCIVMHMTCNFTLPPYHYHHHHHHHHHHYHQHQSPARVEIVLPYPHRTRGKGTRTQPVPEDILKSLSIPVPVPVVIFKSLPIPDPYPAYFQPTRILPVTCSLYPSCTPIVPVLCNFVPLFHHNNTHILFLISYLKLYTIIFINII